MTSLETPSDEMYTEISRLNNELVNMQRELAKRNAELERWKTSLETLVNERTAALARSYDLTLEGWARTLEFREEGTAGHSARVVELAYRFAQYCGMQEEDLIHLRRGALLHDLGKIGIPDKILLKPGKLDAEEWAVMKNHPNYALKLLQDIPYLSQAVVIPYCHHERWDGSGYPCGLKAEEIPLAARIFSLVDVFDALISDRPYREHWEKEKALNLIREEAGFQFDPHLAKEFLEFMKTVE